ncbi:RraA family protein [Jannaschia sp. LMIT008]|uniref:RraA family protein n=1 Tax=Jannaschia maritima TaxID=3032585 RepID=UPI00281234B8|nr:RraA family protein [Jannaschia sp. LMIT008]
MTASRSILDHLEGFDTPTICNALEVVQADLRGVGATHRGFVSTASAGGTSWDGKGRRAICGPAVTARIRARDPGERSAPAVRSEWYRRVAGSPGCVVAIEDLDDGTGDGPVGAFWGEVNSAVHARLGARGAVTNGVIRDLDDLDGRFLLLGGKVAPSHHFVRWVDQGAGATVLGMAVAEGDLIHADRHGAVRIPADALDALPDAVAEMQRREAPLIGWARADGPADLDALDRIIGALH